MDSVTGKAPVIVVVVVFRLTSIGGFPRERAERVEPLEFEAAVVTEQFVQTCELQNHRGIMIATLNARTLAPGTPHKKVLSLKSQVSDLRLGLRSQVLLEDPQESESIYDLRFTIHCFLPDKVGWGRDCSK